MAKNNIPDYSSSNEKRMEKFFDAVNTQVSDEMDRIIAEGVDEKTRILKEVNDEAAKNAYDNIQQCAKVSADKYGLVVNKAELDMKKDILKFRAELVDKMFGEIKEKLITFRQSDKYLPYLIRLISASDLEDGVVIHLGSGDMKYADKLKKELKVNASFYEDELIRLGGLSVFYPEKSVIDDRTIDTALVEGKKKFAASGKFSLC